jgi:hypothetical protein
MIPPLVKKKMNERKRLFKKLKKVKDPGTKIRINEPKIDI